MTPSAKLATGAAVVVASIGYLAYVGAASSWQYYLSVDELADQETQFVGKSIRVSGRVTEGSLWVADDRTGATFDLAGQRHALRVTCRCALPDNLAENADVVVEGILRDDGIHARKVITRCASKYESETRAGGNHGKLSANRAVTQIRHVRLRT